MILVYESTETTFSHLGLGTITPMSAPVIEEHNGQYKLSIAHPIDEEGKWKKLVRGRIVVVPTHDGLQPFRLFKPYINSDTGIIDVSAVHVFYDTYDNFIEDTRPTAKDGQDAGDAILVGMQYSTPHTFESDVTAPHTAYYIRKNPVEAFIGSQDNSFKNRWTSVIKRDGFHIAMNTRRGSDKGFRIAFRKNLVGVEMSDDDSRVVTRIMPTALDVDGTVFTTDVKYYDSPIIGNYPHPKVGLLDTGIRIGQVVDGVIPYIDIASAKVAMAQMAQDAFTAGADKPEMTLRVRFVDLGDTEEYAQYKGLITANIDDDVTVEHLDFGIEIKARVVYIEWDALMNRASEIVLGNVMPNIAHTLVSSNADILNLQEEVSGGYASLKLTVDGLVTTVTAAEGDISTLEQFADSLTLSVTNGSTSSTIKLMAGSTEIASKSISFSGMVTFSNLTDGSTTISGSNIKTGTIAADRIDVANLSVRKISNVSGSCYGVIGNTAQGDGLLLYNGSTLGLALTVDSSGIWIKDANRLKAAFYKNSGAHLYDDEGSWSFVSDSSCTEIRFNTNTVLGVDSTGPYYQKPGQFKAYF